MIEKIPKEEWWIGKSKSINKKVNAQQIKTSENGESECEDFSEERIVADTIVPWSGAHTFGWSDAHLRPRGNVSNCKKHIGDVKFSGARGVRKQPKIKVNHQMDDVISLDSASHVTIFKQKDHVKNISKDKHWIYSSGEGGSCSKLVCKISGIKGDNVLEKNYMSNRLSLACVAESHRVTMGKIFDDSFSANT